MGGLCLPACATAMDTHAAAGASPEDEPDAGGSSGAGGGTPCTMADDCTALPDTCNVGACVNGSCATLATNEDGPCDDGSMCTLTEVCKSGVCTAQTQAFCPASDACHIGMGDVAADSCTEIAGNDGAPQESRFSAKKRLSCGAARATRPFPALSVWACSAAGEHQDALVVNRMRSLVVK